MKVGQSGNIRSGCKTFSRSFQKEMPNNKEQNKISYESSQKMTKFLFSDSQVRV